MKNLRLFFLLLIYNLIFIPILFVVFHLLGFLNHKVRKGIKGRKKLFEDLEQKIKEKINPQKPTFWFHSSSLGEFEQAKPIILKLREKLNPNIVVTFFSPSGYEPSINYPLADIISYLPFDSIFKARKFIKLFKSEKTYLFLMKYDIWPNHIYFAYKNNFVLCLANAVMDEKKISSGFKKFFYKTIYELFDYIFLISPESEIRLKKLNLNENKPKVLTTGDTRYDQVYLRSKDALRKPILLDSVIKTNNGRKKKIFVVGSSWSEDEKILIPTILKIKKYETEILTIFVPHEPVEKNLKEIEDELNGKITHIRFSNIKNYNQENVIIVDAVGFLMSLYAYADIAYVGGGFKHGVHNVLEPATYRIPVIYGPRIENSPEAQKLIQVGGAIKIENKKQLYKALRKLLSDERLRVEFGERAFALVQSNLGATDKIIQAIEPNL